MKTVTNVAGRSSPVGVVHAGRRAAGHIVAACGRGGELRYDRTTERVIERVTCARCREKFALPGEVSLHSAKHYRTVTF